MPATIAKKNCPQCAETFEITAKDLAFYDKVSPVFGGKKQAVPPPTLCPNCRQQRRLAWRNERNLYWRTCDGTGKQILSVFHPDTPFKVYDVDYWYSDNWDAKEYGRDFDFNRPFFEQFEELMKDVPQIARSVIGNQNCDYVNQCGWCKNCYLIFEANDNEDCLYSGYIYYSKSCMEALMVNHSELCYECVDVRKGYNLRYCQNSQSCSDSWFLKNCVSCKNCFGSVNLRNKEYCFFNEQLTKEEYEQKVQELELEKYANIQSMVKKFDAFQKSQIQRAYKGSNNENSTGDVLFNSKDCKECYDTANAQDCAYILYGDGLKDVYDMTVWGKGSELCYEVHEVGENVQNILFSDQTFSSVYNILYSKLCVNNSNNLFGCVGLKSSSYCIFNKQYTKEEYEELAPKIIEHMKKTGEWGEFFPAAMSPFGYDETMAQEHFPLTKEEALAQEFLWTEYKIPPPTAPKTIPGSQLPETIAEVTEDILKSAIECEVTQKPFKITAQELRFYQKHNLPLPRKHPDQRHWERFALRNPHRLWKRPCANCQTDMQTSYAPDRPETVYCEACYLKEVY